jgi:hypothetical protein
MDDPYSDLVSSEDIAERLDIRHRASINTMLARGTDGFPAPVVDKGKCRLWRWTQVREWAVRTGRLEA